MTWRRCDAWQHLLPSENAELRRPTYQVWLFAAMSVSDWIAPVPGNSLKAQCRFCHVKLNAHVTDLRRHIETSKHVRNALKQRNTEAQSSAENEPPADGKHCIVLFFSLVWSLSTGRLFIKSELCLQKKRLTSCCDFVLPVPILMKIGR